MENSEFIVLLIIGIAVVAFVTSRKKNGKYANWYVKSFFGGSKLILDKLNEFKIKKNSKLKNGYTEKQIQEQLDEFLCANFETVIREYALEGSNIQRIDFDIANGAVGIEVKLADHAIKESEWQRLLGQISKYVKKKYGENKLIVLVAGDKKNESSAKINEVKKDVEEYGAIFKYMAID